MVMVLYRDCYRDVVTTTSPVLPESPRTGAAAAAGTEVPASGQWRCWRLDAEQEERGGRSLASHRPGAARWAHYSSQEIQRSRYFAVYTDTGLGGQISALDLEA